MRCRDMRSGVRKLPATSARLIHQAAYRVAPPCGNVCKQNPATVVVVRHRAIYKSASQNFVSFYIYLYSSKNDSNQTNRKEQKKLDSEHNIENTVTYTPT